MPPTGGYGGNTGVQDAHNLAWKLAFVLRGEAGPELLSTYDPERRPVAKSIVEQAYTRYVLRLAPELGKEGLHAMVDDAAIDLGYRYRSDAVVSDAESEELYVNPREPAAVAGARAPHIALAGGSTLDLFGKEFVMLTADETWRDGPSVQVHVISEPAFRDAYGSGATLVRPDGFVAWRTNEEPCNDALAAVLARILGR
jgi:hypothetical protein